MDIRDVYIPQLGLAGTLQLPHPAHGLVVFAHGSGSSRLSPRNIAVAEALNGCDMATLLFDLLTVDEEDNRTNVFDIPLLARRLVDVVHWVEGQPVTKTLPLGLFGGSTGAAAAIVAAAALGDRVTAIVSRGRPPGPCRVGAPRTPGRHPDRPHDQIGDRQQGKHADEQDRAEPMQDHLVETLKNSPRGLNEDGRPLIRDVDAPFDARELAQQVFWFTTLAVGSGEPSELRCCAAAGVAAATTARTAIAASKQRQYARGIVMVILLCDT